MERFTFSIFGPRENISPASKFIVSILALQYQHMCAGSTEKNKCSCFLFAIFCLFYQRPNSVHRPDCFLPVQSGLSVLIPIFLPQRLREAYFLAMVLFLKMSLQLSRTLAVPGIAQPREHFFCFSTQIFLRERKKTIKKHKCACAFYVGFFKPPGGRTRLSLSLCLSLSFSLLSVTEIAPDFRSWRCRGWLGFVEAVQAETLAWLKICPTWGPVEPTGPWLRQLRWPRLKPSQGTRWKQHSRLNKKQRERRDIKEREKWRTDCVDLFNVLHNRTFFGTGQTSL